MHGDQHVITVAELIEHLKKFPPNAEVIYRCCSDWAPMTSDEVTLAAAEEKKIMYRAANGYSDYDPRFKHKSLDPDTLDFRTCVLFPGN